MAFRLCKPCRLQLASVPSQAKICFLLPRRYNSSIAATSDPLGPRPPQIPVPRIDIKHIRANPGLYELECKNRNYPSLARHSWRILALHQDVLEIQHKLQSWRRESNQLDDRIKQLSKSQSSSKTNEISSAIQKLVQEKRPLQEKINDMQPLEKSKQQEIVTLAAELPNLSSSNTPVGAEAEMLSTHGDITAKHQVSHEEIGVELDIIDIKSGAAVSGWGFYYLKGAGAMLENALVQYALSKARAAGFTPVIPPSLVYNHTAWSCGYRPRDEGGNQQIYVIESDSEQGHETPKLALAGTAEIPLAAMYMNRTLSPADLPIKHVAVSRSYRAEAGSRGAETKGLYRVHEFTKVELFAWTLPDSSVDSDSDSDSESGTKSTPSRFSASTPTSPSTTTLHEMLALQHAILEPLRLPLRTLNQPTQDLGASAACKYDVEAFFPSRTRAPWGELSSLSSCTDYQTRRLNTRMAPSSAARTAGSEPWPYTLNGTAMAVPRVLAALLENGWDVERRVVRLPECLWPWMDGIKEISKSA
jgi:seryl-tRNA synthetase